MVRDPAPLLSVVIVAFNGPLYLRRCIYSLTLQPRFREVEVHIVSNQSARLEIEYVSGADNVHCHPVPASTTVPLMRSLGIENSRGRLVALLEDDCTVGPHWLDSLLAAHEKARPVVGGAVEPGDYSRPIDWAVYYCEYARFLAPLSGAVAALPGNNVSYRREFLQSLDTGSGFHEVFIHPELQATGSELYAAEDMVIFSVNRRCHADCIATPYHHGRAYAARRFSARDWRSRTLYFLLSPLLPILKSLRTLREIRTRRRPELPVIAVLPWIVLFHCCWSAGECLGYLAGAGNSAQRWG